MYLDIGNDIILNWDDILIILTEETALKDKKISFLIKEGKIANPFYDHKIHSYILAEKKGKEELYISSFTTQTLIKRFVI
ncbi:MAG: DUF370 domain-containing protein [Gallicola sp.]|nr:DUF370 domain-containing protein [Gallicola sp.]